MITETAKMLDKTQIRQLISDQMTAICTKNTDRIMSHYAPEAIIFDVKPLFQKIKNTNELRRAWDACLPCLPVSFGTEMRDLGIFVSGDLALAHWFWRFTGMEQDHPTIQTWIRSTVGYQRHQDRWQIVHEHCSTSLDPESSKTLLTIEP
ncbi:MAG: nuclear transport factor 2 family protein [Methylobacter sp.]|nr:nuclear transport factor 2 family protein [Methylobacter sp.]